MDCGLLGPGGQGVWRPTGVFGVVGVSFREDAHEPYDSRAVN